MCVFAWKYVCVCVETPAKILRPIYTAIRQCNLRFLMVAPLDGFARPTCALKGAAGARPEPDASGSDLLGQHGPAQGVAQLQICAEGVQRGGVRGAYEGPAADVRCVDAAEVVIVKPSHVWIFGPAERACSRPVAVGGTRGAVVGQGRSSIAARPRRATSAF